MIRSTFSNSGVHIGENRDNMSYAYGLGDFFSLMFEDTSVPNLLLEADTLTASEVYSRFLQLTSTLSLEDIQTTVGSQIKLVLLDSSDLVEGTLSTYKLPLSIASSRYVANRPIMPTALLEDKVDFDITQDDYGNCFIRLAKPLASSTGYHPYSEYAFSSRVLPNGNTQYALWFVDVNVDEGLVAKYFGNLLGVQAKSSTEAFANFVYGLYYVYTQGPTLTVLKRGLNLVLGIPLARMDETVIDIRMYLQTDQYLVLTDENQYVIPYGLPPSVSIGDRVKAGQELAEWIEVKDFSNDGEWWVNLYIPTTIIPEPQSGYVSRYATPGSPVDYVMRNYLKTHTFLVRVNVTTFKNLQTFSDLISVIKKSKPAYTQPIYVWAVGNDEVLGLEESNLGIQIDSREELDLGNSYPHMKRYSSAPLNRSNTRFIRWNSPASVASAIGSDATLKSSNNNVQQVGISGYSNPQSMTRGNSWEELDWINILATRSSDTWRGTRDQVGYRRGNIVSYVDPVRSGEYTTVLNGSIPELNGWSQSTAASIDSSHVNEAYDIPQESLLHDYVQLSSVFKELPTSARIVPLAVLLKEEVDQKLDILSLTYDSVSGRTLIPVTKISRYINRNEIHYPILEQSLQSLWGSSTNPSPLDLVKFIGTRHYKLCSEDSVPGYWLTPPPSMNKDMCPSMLYQGATSLAAASEGDSLLIADITCQLKAVYLVSIDSQSSMPSCLPIENTTEPTSAVVSGLASRGMATHNSPFYLRRGSLTLSDQSESPTIPDAKEELLSFLSDSRVAEGSKVIPLSVISTSEVLDKAALWGEPVSTTDQYYMLRHPYPKRVRAEYGLKKASWFTALSPSLNSMYQDSSGTTPVTGYEQPVGLISDRYGLGGDAIQTVADRRPVVRARYNLLRYTGFEGSVPGSASSGTGTPPTDWSVQASSTAAYIGAYSNGVLRLECTSSSIRLQQNQSLPAGVSARYRIVITINSYGLNLSELVDVVQVSGSFTITYSVNGATVNPLTYIPVSNTEVIATLRNTGASSCIAGLRMGVGLYSYSLSQSVTGVAAFKEPDYRLVTGPVNLPRYQRVGNPVMGSSLLTGTPDYDATGFPPYLYFDGANDYLVIQPSVTFGSYKLSSFINFTKYSGSSSSTLFEAVCTTATSNAKFKVYSGSSVSVKTVSPSGKELEYSYPSTSAPVYGTFTAVLDTQSDTGQNQLRLYRDGQAVSGTPVSTGPVEEFFTQGVSIYIGASASSTEFFNGNIYSFVLESQSADVSDRAATEDWIAGELVSGKSVDRPSLYHYPDFFRRDSKWPDINGVTTGSIFEYTPSSDIIDRDWGYDKVLAYNLSSGATALYWICSREVLGPTDYWVVSYQNGGDVARVDSGIPSQLGKTVVPPYRQLGSLNYEYLNLGVNSVALNSLVDTSSPVFSYSDYINTNIAISRNGMVLKQAVAIQ